MAVRYRAVADINVNGLRGPERKPAPPMATLRQLISSIPGLERVAAHQCKAVAEKLFNRALLIGDNASASDEQRPLSCECALKSHPSCRRR